MPTGSFSGFSIFSAGMMTAAALLKDSSARSGAYGSFSVIRTVDGIERLDLLDLVGRLLAARTRLPSSASSEAITSSEVMAEPSWNVTPWRSGMV